VQPLQHRLLLRPHRHRLLRPLCAAPPGHSATSRAPPPINPMCVALTRIPPPFAYSIRRFNWSKHSWRFLSIPTGINHFHKSADRELFETDAVLRVMLGKFLFFTILAITMAGIISVNCLGLNFRYIWGWGLVSGWRTAGMTCFFSTRHWSSAPMTKTGTILSGVTKVWDKIAYIN
jgi:hypothetical protein